MKPLIILILFSFPLLTWSATSVQNTSRIKCNLPEGEKLIIGCTNYCGRFNRWAIKSAARKLGYKVSIVNLRSRNQTIDHTQVDGVIIPGGSDIDPKWYIKSVTPEFQDYLNSVKHLTNYSNIGKVRDEFEFGFLEEYFKNREQRYQPVLGICRGMQVLTASQGIPLYVDIKHELGIKNRRYTLDKVTIIKPESLIKELIGRKSFRAVELHHQGLNLDYFYKHRENWPHLDVTALSNGNKIAESLEFYNRPILGVQFHPEYTFGNTRRGIFQWLLKRSCFNKVMGKKLTKGNK
jgi:putative glutamine amidotransferase